MANEEIEEVEMFECPNCGSEVTGDVTTCPNCSVVFEGEEQTTTSAFEQEKGSFSFKMREKPVPPPPEDEEEPILSEMEGETEANAVPEMTGEDNTTEDPIPSENREEEGEAELEGGMPEEEAQEELKTSEEAEIGEEPSAIEEEVQEEPDKDLKVKEALTDYGKRRRTRYLQGTLSLGLGIIFFALLWLFVVYDVLVTETENWFGAEVIIILVFAGIFFIIGLYLILTYPKSSLAELFPMMSEREREE